MSILIDQLMREARNGSVEGVRQGLKKNDINVQDKQGLSLLHHAVINNKRKVMVMLVEEGAMIDIQDKEGRTPLHHASAMNSKELILFLLMQKADQSIEDNEKKRAGSGNPDMSIFIENIIEEEKCFKILTPEQVKKLSDIFMDIDYDRTGKISMKKAIAFNHFIDPRVSNTVLMRDAEDFIEDVAVINRQDVCLDEWLFSFSKLLYCDKKVFEKFISDYEQAINTAGGRFTEIMNSRDAEDI